MCETESALWLPGGFKTHDSGPKRRPGVSTPLPSHKSQPGIAEFDVLIVQTLDKLICFIMFEKHLEGCKKGASVNLSSNQFTPSGLG
jgi:hypothetical protein